MIIYSIYNKQSHRVYIGQAKSKKRFSTHLANLRQNKHHNRHLQSSFNKHGESAFEFDILEEHPSHELLNEAESFYITYLRYCGARLFNVTGGGDCRKLPPEECALIGARRRGKKHTPETKLRMSLNRKGKISQHTKDAVSRANRSRINQKPNEHHARRSPIHPMGARTPDVRPVGLQE